MSSDSDSEPEVYYDTTSSELRDAALSKATRASYNKNVNKFLLFTRLTSSQLIHLSTVLIDQRLSEYIDAMFARHDSFDYASQTLY